MASFVLERGEKQGTQEIADNLGFATVALAHNVRWFINIRWVIICILSAFAVSFELMPELMREAGLTPPHVWPWAISSCLMIANIAFWTASRKLDTASDPRIVEINMWLQILVDLAAVTTLVYFIGSTRTFVAFLYLLHIVCACIFFPPRRSFLVASFSAALYTFCVVLQHFGILEPTTILQSETMDAAMYPWIPPAFAASAIIIWFAVWYLVQRIARAVVRRDIQLQKANEQLLRADEEKNRLVLRTAHDLKAPFSGIESNIQILRLQCGDELSEKAREILSRIERRSHSLATRIKDILLLGEIRAQTTSDESPRSFGLEAVIRSILSELEDHAEKRGIRINTRLQNVEVTGNQTRYSILFLNLISNAVTYAYEGASVTISMEDKGTDFAVSIADEGIGIAEEALPHIFDEYYRTSEAATYNPRSTGLGLAIVKEIAQKEGLKIAVESVKGSGTTFTILIPREYCSPKQNAYTTNIN